MASKFSLKQKRFLICVLVVSLPFMLFTLSMKNQRVVVGKIHVEKKITRPVWLDIIAKHINSKNEIKIGLVNIDPKVDVNMYQQLGTLHPQVKSVSVDLAHISEDLKWEDFFPEWIDENEKWGKPNCPHVPMPEFESYRDVNVVVAKVPCRVRDLFGLQLNLVVANLAVESGWVATLETRDQRKVFVVFVGSCGPMEEIFLCDELLVHEAGEFWVYMPDLWSLKQKTLMPVGSCQIAPDYAEIDQELWRSSERLPGSIKKHQNRTLDVPKYAYVTVLHSSEAYVCGAIALAQSILQANKKNFRRLEKVDLVLLADKSIGPKLVKGLKSAGWKIKEIERILSPFAKKGAYNEWNYSKLRIWELTMYDKIIFIDSDLLVLKSINNFFTYPQLSASPNDLTLFNSGLMVIEPSKCMFETMLSKTSKVKSYNGGDQGFLNEIFTWWHRLPSKMNHLKSFQRRNGKHEVPENLYTIHYLGLKPWMCYRDYDCNWDMEDHHIFASDSAHEKWWKVYDAMPKKLQGYCGLTEEMNERIVKWRRKARNASLADGHWKIEVKDPRKKDYLSD